MVRTAAFFIRGQCDDDVAIRLESLAFVADQIRDPHRRLRLVVAGAAPVEIAVLLDELERIRAPVLALRLDHIRVGKQQNPPSRAPTLRSYDENLPCPEWPA